MKSFASPSRATGATPLVPTRRLEISRSVMTQGYRRGRSQGRRTEGTPSNDRPYVQNFPENSSQNFPSPYREDEGTPYAPPYMPPRRRYPRSDSSRSRYYEDRDSYSRQTDREEDEDETEPSTSSSTPNRTPSYRRRAYRRPARPYSPPFASTRNFLDDPLTPADLGADNDPTSPNFPPPPAKPPLRVQKSLLRMIDAYKRGALKMRGYVGEDLRPDDARNYSAAGIAFYDFSPSNGDMLLLMLRQQTEGVTNSLKNAKYGSWNFPGGKRDENDSCAEETAAREAQEETGGLLKMRRIQPFLRTVVFSQIGKYALFLQHLPGEEDIPERYQELLRVGVHCSGSSKRDTVELAWIPLKVLRRLKTQPDAGVPLHMFIGYMLLKTPLLRHLVQIEQQHKLQLRRVREGLDASPDQPLRPASPPLPSDDPRTNDLRKLTPFPIIRHTWNDARSATGAGAAASRSPREPQPRPASPPVLASDSFASALRRRALSSDRRAPSGLQPDQPQQQSSSPFPAAPFPSYASSMEQEASTAGHPGTGVPSDPSQPPGDAPIPFDELIGFSLRRRSFLRVGLAGYTVATHSKYTCEVCGIDFARAQDTEAHLRSRYHRRRVQRLLFKELTRKLLEDGQVSTVLREPKNLHPRPNAQVLDGMAGVDFEGALSRPLASIPMSEPALKHLRTPWEPFAQQIRSHPKYVCEVCNIRFARAEDTVAHLKGPQHRTRVQRLLMEELVSLQQESEAGEDSGPEEGSLEGLLGATVTAVYGSDLLEGVPQEEASVVQFESLQGGREAFVGEDGVFGEVVPMEEEEEEEVGPRPKGRAKGKKRVVTPEGGEVKVPAGANPTAAALIRRKGRARRKAQAGSGKAAAAAESEVPSPTVGPSDEGPAQCQEEGPA